MDELFRFIQNSTNTLDLKVGNEAAADAPADALPPEEETPESKQAKADETRKALFAIMSCMRDMRKRETRTGQQCLGGLHCSASLTAAF